MRSEANRAGIFQPIKGELYLWILFNLEHVYNKDGSFNKRQPDFDNLLCGPVDCLESAGIIENDNQIMESHIKKSHSNETSVTIKLFNYPVI